MKKTQAQRAEIFSKGCTASTKWTWVSNSGKFVSRTYACNQSLTLTYNSQTRRKIEENISYVITQNTQLAFVIICVIILSPSLCKLKIPRGEGPWVSGTGVSVTVYQLWA